MMQAMDHLKGLNKQQKEAVLQTEGPVLIVAGAGAGKTKTITSRIVHLIHQGIQPNSILAITFTNKAAAEMRERVVLALAGERLDTMPIVRTFHSLGVSILKEHAALVGRTKNFSILDEDDTVRLVKQAIIEADLDPKQYEPKKFRHIISRQKGDFINIDDFEARASTFFETTLAKIWRKYEKKLDEEQGFDFDDLLLKTVTLLRDNETIREHYQKKFQYIHIDEYQDTNEVQYELTKLLVGPAHNICVVGDTDQNIYSWRGAKIKNMINFEKDFPDAKIFFLEQNYRSTKTILSAANRVIEKNTVRVPKTLFTENTDGEQISIYESYDERDEAEFVSERADTLIESGVSPSDIAVLYRANFQSRILEEAFLDRGVPYTVLGVKFYERKEVKDMLGYIRAARNPKSLSDIKRIINIPPRGIGKVTLIKLFAGMKRELPAGMQKKISNFYDLLNRIALFIPEHIPSEIVKYILQESGIETHLKNGTSEDLERLENIKELVTLATKYDTLPEGEGIEKMLEDAALSTDQDTLLEAPNGVKLMTVHAAKGLEFKYVFIVGLEQDLFPHQKRDGGAVEDNEEERRLFYVALTRAREKLFLSYATIRTLFGMRQVNTPSEFLYDIPEELSMRDVRQVPKTKIVYLD